MKVTDDVTIEYIYKQGMKITTTKKHFYTEQVKETL